MKTNVWSSVIIALILSSLVFTGCASSTSKSEILSATAGDGEVSLNWTAVAKASSYNIYWSTKSGVTPSNGTLVSDVTSTSYVQTGLINGTTYYYVVTAVNGSGAVISKTDQASATPSGAGATLSGPTGVAATPGDSQVVLSWIPVAGATSYNIYWSTTSGVTSTNGSEISGTTTASYTQTGLTNGTTYYYVVTAETSAGESKASYQASAIPAVSPAPAEPSEITISSGNGQVTISWTAVPNATSYNIYWSTTNGVTPANGTKITGVTTPEYTQSGLTNGTAYYYVITAVDTNGESTPSFQVSAIPPETGTEISAPTGVTATPGDSQVVISWTPLAGAFFYNIYWSTTSGVTPDDSTEEIAGVDASSYTQTGLTNGTTYYYVVTAETNAGESEASPQASAIPAVSPAPAEPAEVSVSPGDGQVSIMWTAVPNATSYNIYWSTTSGVTPASGTEIAGVTAPAYTQTGLINNTTYYYVVTALDANGESTPSNQVSVTPLR